MVCTKQLLDTELKYGAFTSLTTAICTTLAFFCVHYLGLKNEKTYNNFIAYVGGFASYSADMLISKQCFQDWKNSEKISNFGYDSNGIKSRLGYYVKSLRSSMFARFMFLNVLETQVVMSIANLLEKQFDSTTWTGVFRVLEKVKHNSVLKAMRDTIFIMIVNALTFFMFSNLARFSWVYVPRPDVTTTLVLAMWFVFMMFYTFHFAKSPAIENENIDLKSAK